MSEYRQRLTCIINAIMCVACWLHILAVLWYFTLTPEPSKVAYVLLGLSFIMAMFAASQLASDGSRHGR